MLLISALLGLDFKERQIFPSICLPARPINDDFSPSQFEINILTVKHCLVVGSTRLSLARLIKMKYSAGGGRCLNTSLQATFGAFYPRGKSGQS